MKIHRSEQPVSTTQREQVQELDYSALYEDA
jgi:hypothetical protein